MADKKLRAAGVWATVGHRNNAPVVVLLRRFCFALYSVARAAGAIAIGAAALYHKIRYHPVEFEAVVKAIAKVAPNAFKNVLRESFKCLTEKSMSAGPTVSEL